jgi:hypothetical protein
MYFSCETHQLPEPGCVAAEWPFEPKGDLIILLYDTRVRLSPASHLIFCWCSCCRHLVMFQAHVSISPIRYVEYVSVTLRRTGSCPKMIESIEHVVGEPVGGETHPSQESGLLGSLFETWKLVLSMTFVVALRALLVTVSFAHPLLPSPKTQM